MTNRSLKFGQLPGYGWISSLLSAFVVTLTLSGCGPNAPDQPDPEVLPLGDVSVHYWFEDNRLLLTGNNSLTIYDLEAKAPLSEITFDQPDSRFNRAICLNEQNGILGFYCQAGRQKFYHVNWSAPEQFTELDTFNGPGEWLYNRQDCSLRENEQPPSLLRSDDAFLDINLDDTDKTNPQLNLVIGPPNSSPESDQARRETIDISVRPPFFRRRRYIDYDPAADSYLLTYNAPSFSSKPDNWNYAGWIFSSDAELQRTVSLPAGPWVYEHGFFKAMSCFSCGCACYESLDLDMRDNQIFSIVHGKAVNDEHQGLYKLDETGDSPTWQPIATGENVDTSFALSPDGCRAAIGTKAGISIYETCEQATP